MHKVIYTSVVQSLLYQIEEQNKIADSVLIYKKAQRATVNLAQTTFESHVRLGSEGMITRPVSASIMQMSRSEI